MSFEFGHLATREPLVLDRDLLEINPLRVRVSDYFREVNMSKFREHARTGNTIVTACQ